VNIQQLAREYETKWLEWQAEQAHLPGTNVLPTREEMRKYWVRYDQLCEELQSAGLKSQPKLPVERKMVNFAIAEMGVHPKDATRKQWDDFFACTEFRIAEANKYSGNGFVVIVRAVNEANGVNMEEPPVHAVVAPKRALNTKQSRREKRLDYQRRRALFEQYWAELVIADANPSIGPRMSDEERQYRAALAKGQPVHPARELVGTPEYQEQSNVYWFYFKALDYLYKRRLEFYRSLKAGERAAAEAVGGKEQCP
jgi:hypothetical protein